MSLITPSGAPLSADDAIVTEFTRDEAAERVMLRRYIRPDALRMACGYWMGWPLTECRRELWLCAVRIDRLCRGFTRPVSEVAYDELDEQIAWVGAYHEESSKLIQAAALEALQEDADRRGVMQAAINVAQDRVPLPPDNLVRQAVESAARDFRFATKFWQRRGRAG